MIGKILSRLLGGAGEDLEEATDTIEELMEFEEGGWVVVNLPAEHVPLSASEVDPLENLLIEHPSMSVYQIRRRMSGQEEEEEEEEEERGSDEEEEVTARPVAVRQRVSWRLAAWGIPLPCDDVRLLRARSQAERKKLSRSALHRQSLAKLRFSPGEKRYGFFKQPCQRLYNY